MKKIMALFGIMLLSAGISFAAIEENDTADIDIMRSQGYSENALRVVDAIKANNQGPTGRYKRHFYDKKSNFLGRAYTRLKNYVDPAQDDHLFGEHEINFTNTFFGDEPPYSIRKTDEIDVENL